MTLQPPRLNFLIYEVNLNFFFISVEIIYERAAFNHNFKNFKINSSYYTDSIE
jgi:hypothetical protein